MVYESESTPTGQIVIKSSMPFHIKAVCYTTGMKPRHHVDLLQGIDTTVSGLPIAQPAGQCGHNGIGWIDFDELNKQTLQDDNPTSVISKDLSFAKGSIIDIVVDVPEIEAELAASQGSVHYGDKLVDHGDGSLEVHPNNLSVDTHTTGLSLTSSLSGYVIDPTVAICFGEYTTSSLPQPIHVLNCGHK